ncbi:MAG: DNA polymerase III subunit delta [Verrucomicrobiota bacterium]
MPKAVQDAGATRATRASALPITLVCGEEEFSVKQRARQLWDQWCQEIPGMDHEILEASAGTVDEALNRIAKVRESLQTLPFFGGDKLVWFRDCTFLGEDRTGQSATVTEALAGLAEEWKTFNWQGLRLLISAGKPDKRRAFFKAFEKLGTVEVFEALSQDDKDWAGKAESEALRTLRAAGKEIGDEALAELVNRVGPNLRMLASECEKLALYTGDRAAVTLGDVQACVSRQKLARAFALAEALGDRNLAKLLKTLDEELWEIRVGTDKRKSEIGLLYGLISKVRSLLMLKELLSNGSLKPARDYNTFKSQLDRIPASSMPADRRFNPLASHPFVLFQAMKQAANYRTDELVEAMGVLLEANRRLVSADLDEALVLQQAAFRIVGLRRKPA